MKVKKYYIDEPDTVHSYLNSRRNSCGCGSNLFHYEYNGTNIYGVCNACETRIYEIKEEYIEECLKKWGRLEITLDFTLQNKLYYY